MMFVDDIIEISRLAIASSFVKNDEPVSVMLLGAPEIGKSTIILRFNPPKGVHIFTDLTKTKLEAFIKEFKNCRYILVPDFIKIVSRGMAAKANITSFLNAGMEEGIFEITQYISGMANTELLEKPVKFGIMTAMTRDVIQDRRREWYRIGFFSRMLPVSFSYSRQQTKKIREHICTGKEIFTEKEKLRLSPRRIVCNKKYPMRFEKFVDQYADAQRLYGFRMTKQIRSLLKASALLRKSGKVGEKDVKKLEHLLHWINLDYNKVV